MPKPHQTSGYLQDHLLIAMPSMGDPRFARTVIYLCFHSEQGAMGLIVNKPMDGITFPELLEQLSVNGGESSTSVQVRFGGPVEPGRGFVLHTTDFMREGSLKMSDQVGLTATVDVLRAMALGQGPRRALLALGYAGWAPGQLDAEIQENAWLHAPCDLDVVFDDADELKWTRAVAKLGIDIGSLSGAAGHA